MWKLFHRILLTRRGSGFVDNFILDKKSPLDGVTKKFGDITLSEITGKSLVSVAIPKDGRKKLVGKMKASFKSKMPEVGHSILSGDGHVRTMAMQSDLMFLLFDDERSDGVVPVEDWLGDAGYYSDQSDSWVMLSISGSGSTKALARICTLDLDAQTFANGAVTRTVMEHMSTIILRTGEDSFMLFSARSSAQSFFHAVEVSILNTIG